MISKNNILFEQLLSIIVEKTGLTDKEISLKVGRNEGYIAQLKSRIKNNNEEIPTKFIELLKLHFASDHILREPEQEDIKENNLYMAMETISNLAQSNRVIADNNTTISQSQLKLVETNAELAIMIKEMINRTTVNDVSETVKASDAKFLGLLEVIADLGVGKIWKSKEEGIALLGTKFYPVLAKKKKAGNAVGAGS